VNSSKLHAQYRDGSKPTGAKVVLESTSAPGGMTNPAYTHNYGTAVVEHSSTGLADVYVSGKKAGSLHTPGETAAFNLLTSASLAASTETFPRKSLLASPSCCSFYVSSEAVQRITSRLVGFIIAHITHRCLDK